MGATYHRYRAANLSAFGGALRAWLASLPASGWAGGVADLEAALWVAAGGPDPPPYWLPRGPGLTRELQRTEHVVRAAGWAVTWRRTAKARTIEFRRLPDRPAGGPKAPARRKRGRGPEKYADKFRAG